MVKERSASIDMVKGLAIMTLFFLHFERGNLIDSSFLFVRSPAFYIVVGWLWGMSSNKRTIKEHWTKRLKGLVVPYLWFSLIFIAIDLVYLAINWIPTQILLRDIYKTIVLRGIGTLWFLPSLLMGELLFLWSRDRSWALKALLYIASFLMMFYYKYWHSIVNYENQALKDILNAPFRVILDSVTAYFYIGIAYYISKGYGNRLFFMAKEWLFFIGAVCCLIGVYMSYFPVDGLDGQAIFVLKNLFAGFGILLLFRSIEKFKPLSFPLSYFGKNSLIVMAMHWALYEFAMLVDKNIMGYSEYSGFRTIVYFVIATIALVGIIELINRKFRFIIGK